MPGDQTDEILSLIGIEGEEAAKLREAGTVA
jgi:hypothetical protein